MIKDSLRSGGLYVITDPTSTTDLPAAVAAALEGGARLVQYRNKLADAVQAEHEARQLLALCQVHDVPLLINDDPLLAARIGAAGVHLGRDDADLAAARALLGEQAIIGLSCYNDLARAQAMATRGADYVAFGRFFPSHTKATAVQADLALLQQARQELQLPIVAIGGITAQNGAALVAAGADWLAVIQGVFAQTDVRAASAAISALFSESDL